MNAPYPTRKVDSAVETDKAFLFSWGELSGGLGDLGLFIPLVVAMARSGDFDLGAILICAGLMNVVTGLLFRQPIPVQPMKAIAVVAIVEGLLHDEVVAAGMLMGALMVGLSISGLIDRIAGLIPMALVRGIQLGIGIKLALMGFGQLTALPVFGWDSVVVGGIALVVLVSLRGTRQPTSLYVFLFGFLLLAISQPFAYEGTRLGLPQLDLQWPKISDWTTGLLRGALPQLPLTLLNSVLAVCALSAHYFPGAGVAPKKMALSVGLMNLFCAPWGGVPMCHGAGGLAAQYGSGARTGGSVIMLGALKVLAGILFGGSLIGVLYSYPVAILGPMLLLAGFELARTASGLRAVEDIITALSTCVVILYADVASGFLAGCAARATIRCFTEVRKHLSERSQAPGHAVIDVPVADQKR